MEQAVIEVGWNQFLVKKWDVFCVKKIKEEVGSEVRFHPLFLSSGERVEIGTPVLENIEVVCRVREQGKWEKIRVFKMHSKKRYMRNKWYRPHVTTLEVVNILY